MIKQPIAFPEGKPLNRRVAAQVVQVASRYESRIMIERAQKIVNAKSMLGLLSLGLEDQTDMHLVVDGKDEEEAVQAMLSLMA